MRPWHVTVNRFSRGRLQPAGDLLDLLRCVRVCRGGVEVSSETSDMQTHQPVHIQTLRHYSVLLSEGMHLIFYRSVNESFLNKHTKRPKHIHTQQAHT